MNPTPEPTTDPTTPERRLWPLFGVLDMLLMTGLMVSWSRRLGLRPPVFMQRILGWHRNGSRKAHSTPDDHQAS